MHEVERLYQCRLRVVSGIVLARVDKNATDGLASAVKMRLFGWRVFSLMPSGHHWELFGVIDF